MRSQDIGEAKSKDKKGKKKEETERPSSEDKQVGRQVLELRKKGAFLGYTAGREEWLWKTKATDRVVESALLRGRMPGVS
jgi:hypothetical protein